MASKTKQYLGLLNRHLQGRMARTKLYEEAGKLGFNETQVDADIARASEKKNCSSDAEQKGATAATSE